MFVYLNRFQQYAVKHNLSAAAILLWQYLYLRMAGRNQFERFHQDTAGLMNLLQITRQGLIGVRKSLEQAGLLAVERDENQRLWYTLQLDGQALQPVGEATRLETKSLCEEGQQTADAWSEIQSGAVRGQQWRTLQMTTIRNQSRKPPQLHWRRKIGERIARFHWVFVSDESRNSVQPITFPDKPGPAGDIVMSREYQIYLKAFCSRYDDSSLHSNLTSWMQQREQNGWTLTLWGSGRIAEKAGAASGRTGRNHGGHCQAVYQAQMEGLSRFENPKPSQRGKAVKAGGKRAPGL